MFLYIFLLCSHALEKHTEVFISKDTWTKSRGREVGSAGVGWRNGEKRQTTVIE